MCDMLEAKSDKRILPCQINELRLDLTLPGGQSFRWHKVNETEWRGVFANKVWTLSQNDDCLFYNSFPSSDIREEEELLKDYFQLNTCLADLYNNWKRADKNFSEIAPRFSGVRVLKQDPIENLFSFICSSNNNIARITTMVEKLCNLYGDVIGEVDKIVYHSFPHPNKLAQEGVEQELKKHKFGYRAAFINKTAQIITKNKDCDWLYKLREVDYPIAHRALLDLNGVGPKVADCVCLMSLDKSQAIPVDTHIFKIASQTYMPSLKSRKSLTDKSYKEIGMTIERLRDHFRNIFGSHAGWAHSVLFSSDLVQFKSLTNDSDCKRPSKKSKTS